MTKLACSICCLLLMVGCAQVRVVTIHTKPADATIRIDGLEAGRGPITHRFEFDSPETIHRVTASRLGFKDATIDLTVDYERPDLLLELKPQTKTVTITILPGPAIVSIDGKPVSDQPISTLTRELEFSVNQAGAWNTHTVTADRDNLTSASAVIRYNDRETSYVLTMPWKKKTFSVNTNPTGAEVMLDFRTLGTSPVENITEEFPVDLDTNEFIPRKLRASKPGYDDVELPISWDEGLTEYTIDLTAKTKTVRFVTDPSGATVKIDGVEVKPDSSGVPTATLQFPPINEQTGELKTYSVTVSRQTDDSIWEPHAFTLTWENGRSEYPITLKEILTRSVPLLEPRMRRGEEGWQIEPEWSQTVAMKDTTEGSGQPSPQQLTRLASGTQIHSLAMSPDGAKLLFTVLNASEGRNEFLSQMIVIPTSGSGGEEIISDGKSLEIMPSYSADGSMIYFSSNRASRRMKIWRMSASGARGITQVTQGETNDLWPSVDSDPKPRLFYQALVDSRADARLYMTQLGTIFMTDLTTISGTQPRVSPRNDAVVFAAVNENTGKRDIYRMSDTGGLPENLTNTPDADECDPSWSKDGSKIVFASDRGADEEGRHHFDLWMIDLSRPQEPTRLTNNASRDDSPIFDVNSNSVIFRSNRGGQWQLWRIGLR